VAGCHAGGYDCGARVLALLAESDACRVGDMPIDSKIARLGPLAFLSAARNNHNARLRGESSPESAAKFYHRIIRRAVRSVGDLPLRVDRLHLTGDIVQKVHLGIRNCDYAIAVLDEMRPNVLYEVGLAHAWGKQAILICRKETLDSDVPFDLSTQRTVVATELNEEFQKNLQAEILALDTHRPANKWAVKSAPLLDS
jgi:hypothetical protein